MFPFHWQLLFIPHSLSPPIPLTSAHPSAYHVSAEPMMLMTFSSPLLQSHTIQITLHEDLFVWLLADSFSYLMCFSIVARGVTK